MHDSTALLMRVLEQHGEGLYALMYKLTLREDAAEELLQDLFVRLHDSSGLADALNCEAYVFRSAINLAFDWRKQTARLAPNVSSVDQCESNSPDPIDRMIRHEEVERILSAMDQLASVGRELITLRYIDGLSYSELAERLSVTPHHARAIASRAISELRELMSSTVPPGKPS